jgi:putative hydrolase of the HAD superfamily
MKTLIFDFGKVVGIFDHYRTLSRLTEYTDMSAQEMYARVYDNDLEDAFEKGLLSGEEFLAQFIKRCRLRCDCEYLHEAVKDIFTANAEVCELIPRLKPQYRILLGSNTNVIHATHYRQQFHDVLRHFDGLVLSYEIGVRKPHAGFYDECLERAECRADECVFIDDMPANIVAARAAGMKGIVYAPGNNLTGKLLELGVRV